MERFYLIRVESEPYIVVGGQPRPEVLGPFNSEEVADQVLAMQGISTWVKVKAISEVLVTYEVTVQP